MYRYAASEWFNRALAALACSGVRGVAIDVWVCLMALYTSLLHSHMASVATVSRDVCSQAYSLTPVLLLHGLLVANVVDRRSRSRSCDQDFDPYVPHTSN